MSTIKLNNKVYKLNFTDKLIKDSIRFIKLGNKLYSLKQEDNKIEHNKISKILIGNNSYKFGTEDILAL